MLNILFVFLTPFLPPFLLPSLIAPFSSFMFPSLPPFLLHSFSPFCPPFGLCPPCSLPSSFLLSLPFSPSLSPHCPTTPYHSLFVPLFLHFFVLPSLAPFLPYLSPLSLLFSCCRLLLLLLLLLPISLSLCSPTFTLTLTHLVAFLCQAASDKWRSEVNQRREAYRQKFLEAEKQKEEAQAAEAAKERERSPSPSKSRKSASTAKGGRKTPSKGKKK